MKNHSLHRCAIGFGVSVLLLGLLGGLSAVAAQEGGACPAARQDYQVAAQSYQDGLFEPAIAAVKTYLRKCPDGEYAPQAHYLLAEILYQQENFVAALHHVTQALAYPLPDNLAPHALLLAAESYRQLGQIEQAERYLQCVVDSRPSPSLQAHAFYWLGEFASQQQRYDDARRYYQRVLEVQESGEYTAYAQYALGWTYRQLGDVPAALKAFTAFLALAPEHEYAPQARFARAALLRQTGQLVAAKAAFANLADQAAPEILDEVLFWWAETAYQLGTYGEAAEVYQQLVTTHPHSVRVGASLYGWGWAEVQQQHCAAARQPWEKLLQQMPDFSQASEVHYQLGVCYVELEMHDLARQHLLAVVEAPSNPAQRHDAILKLASLAFNEKRYAEAVGYYGRALSASSAEERPSLYYVLGDSYAALGKYTAAIEQWQQVLATPELGTLQFRALYRIGQAYIEQKAWRQAIPVLRRLWEKAPKFPSRPVLAAYLINAYREIGQCAEALPFYDALIQGATKPQQSLSAIRSKAACLYESKRYEDVVQLLAPQITAEINTSTDPVPIYLLSQAYLQLQQDEAALAPLSLLLKQFPSHPLATTAAPQLAKILEAHDRRKEALAIWQFFLRHKPSQNVQKVAALRLHIGHLALQEGLLTDALDVLAPVRGVGVPSLAAEALFWSGEVYLKQQQLELALQVYQELIDTYPAEEHWHALASFRIGVIYEQQQDWDRALHIYRALQAATIDQDIRVNAQQRIVAIEAGRVVQPPPSSLSSSDS